MDPALEKTSGGETRHREHERNKRMKINQKIRQRQRSAFEIWVWTELPAYRLGLLLGYSFAVYFGISALVAGVPAFNSTAPDGWVFLWSSMLIVGGPIGIIGILKDSPKYRKIELLSSLMIAWSLSIYAVTVLYIAYTIGDITRMAAGAAFAWLASGSVIRMFWLVSTVLIDHQISKASKVKGE